MVNSLRLLIFCPCQKFMINFVKENGLLTPNPLF